MPELPDVLGTWSETTRQLRGLADAVSGQAAHVPAMLAALERTPEALRAQATAFRTASMAFAQAAEVLDVQATAMEQAFAAVTAPVHVAQRGIERLHGAAGGGRP
jgi:hypothetical protein